MRRRIFLLFITAPETPQKAPYLTTTCFRDPLDDYLLKLPPSEEIASLLFRPLAHDVRPAVAAAEQNLKVIQH